MSTVKAANLQNTGSGAPAVKNSSGTEIGQFAKAWVSFNGTGTVAIRDDFNVTSITDNQTGDYTVNYTNNFANANYSVVASGGGTSGVPVCKVIRTDEDLTTGTTRIQLLNASGLSRFNNRYVYVAAFGD